MAAEIEHPFARWSAEKPALDTESLGLTARLLRVARQIEVGRRHLLAARDLEIWEYDVLAALRAAGTPHQLSPTELMAATIAASGTVTNRIDRLAARGFVLRQNDPVDRRGVTVKLTPAGRRRVDAAAAAVAEVEALMWGGLSARRRDQLTGALRDLLQSSASMSI